MCDSLCAVQPGRHAVRQELRPSPRRAAGHRGARRPRRRAAVAAHPVPRRSPTRVRRALIGARARRGCGGFEHGVNEHRVAIGNEQLWTVDDPSRQPEALTGMDLVRLGLERGRTAEEALDVVTELHRPSSARAASATGDDGQGLLLVVPGRRPRRGVGARDERPLVGRPARSAADEGGVALSNRISLSTDWTRASADVAEAGDFDRWRRASSPTAHADKRLAVTAPGGAGRRPTRHRRPTAGARELAAVLRHHGSRAVGTAGRRPAPTSTACRRPSIDRLGTGVSLCMHLHRRAGHDVVDDRLAPPRPGRAAPGAGSRRATRASRVFVPTFGVDGVAPELADAGHLAPLRRRCAAGSSRPVRTTGRRRAGSAAPRSGPCWARSRPSCGTRPTPWPSADPGRRRAWAAGLWPRIEPGLVALRA